MGDFLEMMKNPCKKCITYAMCKNKDHVKCSILFDYCLNNNLVPMDILPSLLWFQVSDDEDIYAGNYLDEWVEDSDETSV